MRSRLPRAAALLILSVGSSLLVWPGTGSADDVDQNAAICERIAKWKATPQAAILIKGVQFEAASPITPPGERKAIALCICVNKLDQTHYIGAKRCPGRRGRGSTARADGLFAFFAIGSYDSLD